MAQRNTISRIASRIDGLTERMAPNRRLLTIVGYDEAECRGRLKEIQAAGGQTGRVRFIITGVPRCNRERPARRA
jgi:hypothetical protein